MSLLEHVGKWVVDAGSNAYHTVVRVGIDVAFWRPECKESWQEKGRLGEVIFDTFHSILHRGEPGPLTEIINVILLESHKIPTRGIYRNIGSSIAVDQSAKIVGATLFVGGVCINTYSIIANLFSNKSELKAIPSIIPNASKVSGSLVEAGISAGVTGTLAASGVAMAALIEDISEQASRASHRLRLKFPDIYRKLRPRNLDMLFFVVEEAMSDHLKDICYSYIISGNKKTKEYAPCYD